MKRKPLFRFIALLFSGALAALPLLTERAALLSFVLWSPFCYFLKRQICENSISPRKAYLCTLFFFQGYFTAAFSFFVAMYPLDFAGLDAFSSVAVILAATILLPFFQAAVFSFSIYLLAVAGRRKLFVFPCSFSLFFATLCLLFFFLQNFTWMGVPWASPAATLASSPILIQSASLFGSSFLTFLILFINALLAEALDFFRVCADTRAILSLSLAFILFFSNLGAGAILMHKEQTTEKSVKIALLQGNSPIKNELSEWRLLDTYEELASKAAREGAKVMLWPESVIHYTLESDEDMQNYFREIARKTGAIQIVGAFSSQMEEDERKLYNSLHIIYPNGEIGETVYHKRRPVPFGEYLPWPTLFSTLIPALTQINMLSRDVDTGEDTHLFDTNYGKMGGLICFDSIYPALARKSVKDGAELLLLATNDTWFDGSFGKKLHASHAVLRAVENRRALARTGNTGYSVIIDSYGRITAAVTPDESGYTVGTITMSKDETLYTKTGDLPVFTAALFLVLHPILCFILLRRKNKPSSKKD